MSIEVRLKELLRVNHLDKHGVIQRIADDLGIHRHTIKKLYENDSTHPSLETIGKLCDWLAKHGVPASDLPQKLIAIRPQGLWEAVCKSRTVTIYLGEYRTTDKTALSARRWISRRDSEAMADIVRFLSTSGNVSGESPQVNTEYVPFVFDPTDSAEQPQRYFVNDIRKAGGMYEDMRASEPYSAVVIGSQRVNYLLEHMVADLFGCKPFCRDPQQRVPIFLKYREFDRDVPSCFGAMNHVPQGYQGEGEPGTYYLDANHNWVAVPWVDNKTDSAVVITVRERGDKSMMLALFGYTGRATLALSKELTSPTAERFWDRAAMVKDREIGLYVCPLRYGTDRLSAAATPKLILEDVIAIPAPIIAEHLQERPEVGETRRPAMSESSDSDPAPVVECEAPVSAGA